MKKSYQFDTKQIHGVAPPGGKLKCEKYCIAVKAKKQYLLTLQVSKYCLLTSQNSVGYLCLPENTPGSPLVYLIRRIQTKGHCRPAEGPEGQG